MVLAVAVAAQRLSAGAFEVEALGVHEHQIEAREQIVPVREQPLLHHAWRAFRPVSLISVAQTFSILPGSNKDAPGVDGQVSRTSKRRLYHGHRSGAREAVSARALEIGAMNYRSVASILANNLDRDAVRRNRAEPTLFDHPNVRGPCYFN